eukprot:s490_g11.t1
MGKRARAVGLPCISLSAVRELAAANDKGLVQQIHKTVQSPAAPRPHESNAPLEVHQPVSSRPWLASRSDTPVCNYTRRARRPDSQDVWSHDQCQKAISDLQRDYTAMSSKGPNASLLKTWELMHRRMHQGRCDYYPLTSDKISRVAAAFKMCGYRSFANYLSKAKEVHIQYGGDWSSDLQLESRRAVRSVTRGIGPVQQRMPFGIDRVIERQRDRAIDYAPLVRDGPIGPHCLVVLGCFFMLREAEASLLLASNVKLDCVDRQVTIRLPSSKTDPAAASVERSWGCLCTTHGVESCPYHLAELQCQFLYKLFGDRASDNTLPFFPTVEGCTVEKLRMVDTLEMMHQQVGLTSTDEDGHRQIGGHSLRLAGSRMLASAGLHVYQIELMARWRSPMLLHYAQTAPLTRITEELADATSRKCMSEKFDRFREEFRRLEKDLKGNSYEGSAIQRIEKIESQLLGIDSRTDNMIREKLQQLRNQLLDKPCEYVRNLSSGTWHVAKAREKRAAASAAAGCTAQRPELVLPRRVSWQTVQDKLTCRALSSKGNGLHKTQTHVARFLPGLWDLNALLGENHVFLEAAQGNVEQLVYYMVTARNKATTEVCATFPETPVGIVAILCLGVGMPALLPTLLFLWPCRNPLDFKPL